VCPASGAHSCSQREQALQPRAQQECVIVPVLARRSGWSTVDRPETHLDGRFDHLPTRVSPPHALWSYSLGESIPASVIARALLASASAQCEWLVVDCAYLISGCSDKTGRLRRLATADSNAARLPQRAERAAMADERGRSSAWKCLEDLWRGARTRFGQPRSSSRICLRASRLDTGAGKTTLIASVADPPSARFGPCPRWRVSTSSPIDDRAHAHRSGRSVPRRRRLPHRARERRRWSGGCKPPKGPSPIRACQISWSRIA